MKKHSNYPIVKNEFYATPEWVTEALLKSQMGGIGTYEFFSKLYGTDFVYWDPCAGDGAITKVLKKRYPDITVKGSDIQPRNSDIETLDFLSDGWVNCGDFSKQIIITNPPFSKSDAFVKKALEMHVSGWFLLRHEWDTAKKRKEIMQYCAAKVVLTQRPRWIKDTTTSPMYNFSWYCFDSEKGEEVSPYAFPCEIYYGE